MSQSAGGGTEPIPFYREYLDHILKPRVIRALEEIRARATERAWTELVARLAEEQKPGASADPEAIQRLRLTLEQGLRLQLSASINATLAGAEPAATPGGPEPRAATPSAEHVESGFPDNPLARAVGGVRRVTR